MNKQISIIYIQQWDSVIVRRQVLEGIAL